MPTVDLETMKPFTSEEVRLLLSDNQEDAYVGKEVINTMTTKINLEIIETQKFNTESPAETPPTRRTVLQGMQAMANYQNHISNEWLTKWSNPEVAGDTGEDPEEQRVEKEVTQRLATLNIRLSPLNYNDLTLQLQMSRFTQVTDACERLKKVDANPRRVQQELIDAYNTFKNNPEIKTGVIVQVLDRCIQLHITDLYTHDQAGSTEAFKATLNLVIPLLSILGQHKTDVQRVINESSLSEEEKNQCTNLLPE